MPAGPLPVLIAPVSCLKLGRALEEHAQRLAKNEAAPNGLHDAYVVGHLQELPAKDVVAPRRLSPHRVRHTGYRIKSRQAKSTNLTTIIINLPFSGPQLHPPLSSTRSSIPTQPVTRPSSRSSIAAPPPHPHQVGLSCTPPDTDTNLHSHRQGRLQSIVAKVHKHEQLAAWFLLGTVYEGQGHWGQALPSSTA